MATKSDERMAEHCLDYRFAYFYGIQRSKQLSVALNTVLAATGSREFVENPKVGVGYELGMEICGGTLGRLSNSPNVPLLKRAGNEPRHAYCHSPNEWLEDPKAQSAVTAWRLILSQHLAPHLDAPELMVDTWIAESSCCYCQHGQREDQRDFERHKQMGIKNQVINVLRPKDWTLRGPRASMRLVQAMHIRPFKALLGAFGAFIKTIGRPRPKDLTISNLNRADPRDMRDAISTLDGDFD